MALKEKNKKKKEETGGSVTSTTVDTNTTKSTPVHAPVQHQSISVLTNNAGKNAPYASNYKPVPSVKTAADINGYDRKNPLIRQYQDTKNRKQDQTSSQKQIPVLQKTATGSNERKPSVQTDLFSVPKSTTKSAQKYASTSDEIDAYLQDGKKLTKDELTRAKQIVSDYYKNDYKANDKSWTDDKQKQFEKITRLQNKTKTGAAFMQGIIDAMPGTHTIEKKASEASGKNSLQENRQDVKAQNNKAVIAGNLAGQTAKYALGSKVMQGVPVVGKATQEAAKVLSKIPVLNKVGANHIANVLGDTVLDVALDTVPRTIDNIASGKSASDVTENAAKNIGMNMAFNVLGEGIGTGIGKLIELKNAKQAAKDTADTVSDVAKQADNAEIPHLKNTEQSVEKPIQNRETVEDVVSKRNLSEVPNTNVNSNQIKNATNPAPTISTDASNLSNPVYQNANDSLANKTSEDLWNELKHGDITESKRVPTLEQEYQPQANTGQKVSKVRTNTMQNADIATDTELKNNFKESDYIYDALSEEESLNIARKKIATLGGNAADDIIQNGIKNSTDIDAAMMSWQDLMNQARKAQEQGIDGSEYLKKADRLMRKVQQIGTESGQSVQAFAKWSRTPEGVMKQTMDVIKDKNVAKLGKQGNVKYDAIINAADNISDAFNGSTSYSDTIKLIRDIQTKNPSVQGMNTIVEIVNECEKQGLPLTQDSFNAVVKNKITNNKKLAKTLGVNADPTTGVYTDTIDVNDFINKINKLNIPSYDSLQKIDNILNNIDSFDRNSEGLQQAIDDINNILSKDFPLSKWDKFVEATHIAMLFNTRTWGRNTLANVALLPEQKMSNKISAVMQNCYAKFNSDFTPNQAIKVSKESKKLAKECFDAEKKGLLSASKYGNEKIASDPLDNLGNRNYFQLKGEKNLPSRIPALEKAGSVFKGGMNKVSQKITGEKLFNNLSSGKSMAENIRMFTYDMLEMGDSPFVKANYVDRLASAIQAENNARLARGVNPITSIDEVPAEFAQLAVDNALKATFKDDNALTELVKGIKKVPIAGEAEIAFGKTPANIVMRSVDYSPAGIVKGMVDSVKKGNVTGGLDEISKGLTGTGVILLGMILAANKVVIASLSDDKDEAEFQKQQGILPYSISTKGLTDWYNKLTGQTINLGDNYITYDWAQPTTSGISIGATLYNCIESGENPFDAESLYNTVKKCASAAVGSVTSGTLFQNIEKTFDTSYGKTPFENFVDIVEEMPLRMLPAAGNAAAKTADLQQRSTYDATSRFNSLKQSAMSKIPALRESLPQAYDTWGQEKKTSESTGQAAFNNFLNPSGTSVATTTEIDSTIQDLFDKTGDNRVFPQKMSYSVQVDSENKIKLNTVQYADYQKNVGQLSYDLAKSYLDNVGDDVDPNAKVESLSKLYGYAKAKYEADTFGKEMTTEYKKMQSLYEVFGSDGITKISIADNISKADENNRNKNGDSVSFGGSSTYKQYQYLMKSGLSSENAGDYLYQYKVAYGSEEIDGENKKLAILYNTYGGEGIAAYCNADMLARQDMSNKTKDGNDRGLSSSTAVKQYQYLIQSNMSPEQAGDYLYEFKASDKEKELYESYGGKALGEFYEFKDTIQSGDEDGKFDNRTALYTLKNSKLSDEMKGAYYRYAAGIQLEKDGRRTKAGKIYADLGDAGIYRYYLYKYQADYDGSGSISKDEVTDFVQYNIEPSEQNYWFDMLKSSSKTKNPFPYLH